MTVRLRGPLGYWDGRQGCDVPQNTEGPAERYERIFKVELDNTFGVRLYIAEVAYMSGGLAVGGRAVGGAQGIEVGASAGAAARGVAEGVYVETALYVFVEAGERARDGDGAGGRRLGEGDGAFDG